ncbi:hypothetical protein B0T26DRAFT_645568, partial [Lasiosphaeria miniovina]
ERADYISATLCLTKAPARLGIAGAQTRWDELHYVHIAQSGYIHFVGAFLPWHRYFLAAHETLLRDECGYRGPMPYWDELADVADLRGAAVFDSATGFGGDGKKTSVRAAAAAGGGGCIADGPFADLRLRFREDLTTVPAGDPGYCLVRNISECAFSNAAQTTLDTCLAARTYEDVWHCLEAKPHIAGHWGVGGIMSNTMLSPGDPLFYLHHAWLDRLWWLWQSKDLATRLTEMGGPNVPTANSTPPAASNYFNDGGGAVTTLNHTLWSAGILPNATIADVMDLHGTFVCADYL